MPWIASLKKFCSISHTMDLLLAKMAWRQSKGGKQEKKTPKTFDLISLHGISEGQGKESRKKQNSTTVSALSTWVWWVCLCFAFSEQTAWNLSDEMGSIWAYLFSRRTALSHFKMSHPDGVLFSLTPLFLPPPLQTNQYPHSLAFHRKDYREMAIKGLASITSPIAKPLKDFGSLGLGPWTWCPVTLQE